ncbi:MAG: hypothetical protein WBM08_06475 [Prochlorococcaceae cyanobacterium]
MVELVSESLLVLRRETYLSQLQRFRAVLSSGRWNDIFALQNELSNVASALAGDLPDQANHIWRLYGEIVNDLTVAVHRVVNTQSTEPVPQPLRSELCTRMSRILKSHLELPVAPPDWLAVLEEQLVQDGAVFWRERIGQETEAAIRSLELFERLADLLDPCPVWVSLACEELRAHAPQDVSPSDQELLPGAIARTVEAELKALPVGGEVLRLGLMWQPGEPLVHREPARLQLNLAPLIDTADPGSDNLALANRGIEAFFIPLRAQPSGRSVVVDDPLVEIVAALAALWGRNVELRPELFASLQFAAAVWEREANALVGETTRLSASSLAPLEPASATLLIDLDTTELATLLSLVFTPEATTRALEQLLEEPGPPQQRRNNWWFDPSDPMENLARLEDKGFPLRSTATPAGDLSFWQERSLECLMVANLWGEAALWASDAGAAWFALPLLQAVSIGSGRPPQLCRTPSPLDLLDLLAGQEVVYVGPHGDLVLEQHQSGRYGQLYIDRPVRAFGLRSLAPPLEGTSFVAQLDDLIEQIEQLDRQRAVQWVVVAGGLTRLPLVNELQLRHNWRCMALSEDGAELFGIRNSRRHCNQTTHPRHAAMWIDLAPLRAESR